MDNVYRQVLAMENHLKGCLDNPSHPAAQGLRQAMTRLLGDIRQKKSADNLELQVQNLKNQVLSLRDDSVMDYGDKDDLKDRCDELVQQLRKLG